MQKEGGEDLFIVPVLYQYKQYYLKYLISSMTNFPWQEAAQMQEWRQLGQQLFFSGQQWRDTKAVIQNQCVLYNLAPSSTFILGYHIELVYKMHTSLFKFVTLCYTESIQNIRMGHMQWSLLLIGNLSLGQQPSRQNELSQIVTQDVTQTQYVTHSLDFSSVL